jgi:hypothetical protein
MDQGVPNPRLKACEKLLQQISEEHLRALLAPEIEAGFREGELETLPGGTPLKERLLQAEALYEATRTVEDQTILQGIEAEVKAWAASEKVAKAFIQHYLAVPGYSLGYVLEDGNLTGSLVASAHVYGLGFDMYHFTPEGELIFKGSFNTSPDQAPIRLVHRATEGSTILNHFDRLETTPHQVQAGEIRYEELVERDEESGFVINAPLGTAFEFSQNVQALQEIYRVKEEIIYDLTEEGASPMEAYKAAGEVDDIAVLMEEVEKDLEAAQQKREKAQKKPISEKKAPASKTQSSSFDPMEEARFLLAEKEYREEQAKIFAKAEKALANRTWHEAVVEYKEAAYETLREIKEDVAARPLYYGAQAAECIPGGVGVAFTVGNQGYKVSTGTSTVAEATRELTIDAAMGVVGAKAVKGIGKAGRFVIGKFGEKIIERRAAKALEELGRIEGGNPKLWNKTVEFKGNKVYQRNDLIDPMRMDPKGRTSISLMEKGKAPIGPDGRSIDAHHMLQTQIGPIAEMTKTFHQKYKKAIHINPNTVPSGIDRGKFKIWREDYWRNRANDFK